MDLSLIRNFGIAAHIDAGKTTISERMLVHTGVERRVGAVDDGTSVLDWMNQERERGITITSAATCIPWRGHQLNLIDTPGHVDFTIEVERCMRVLDGAVLVLDGVVGVQAQSETVWRQMKRHGVPAIAFVNKCDRAGADYLAAVESLDVRLGVHGVLIQMPVFVDEKLHSIIDLVEMRAYLFPRNSYGRDLVEVEIPADALDECGVLRSDMLDSLADGDDSIMELVLDDREPEPEEIRAALRSAVLAGRMVPVLCGAALRDIGVRPLLNAIVDYLPSPLDVPAAVGRRLSDGMDMEIAPSPDGPPCALAFKLHAAPEGDLTFARIYSGTIEPGMVLFNPRTQISEQVASVMRIHADDHQELNSASAGDIVGMTGLTSTGTGDTLCLEAFALTLESLEFPDPVIRRVIEPESGDDRAKVRAALARLAHEDPTFRVKEHASGQWTVGGMGELHLEIIEHRLKGEFELDLQVGQPRVAYRECLTISGESDGEVDRVIGGQAAYARVRVMVEPDLDQVRPRVIFEQDCVPSEGLREAMDRALRQEAYVGPRFGYPLSRASIRVISAVSKEGQESEVASIQAAISALRQAMPSEGVELREPLMAFEIQTPADFSSAIIADLNSRHAEILEVLSDRDLRTIRGTVPLNSMFGYSTGVRSLSQGRASFAMTPQGFRAVPEEELGKRGLIWH